MRSQIHLLELVYPPISNQEADWLWEVPSVRQYVARSKLYMIGQRREVRFANFREASDNITICFDLISGDQIIEGIKICLAEVLSDYTVDRIDVELGPKLIRVWPVDSSNDTEEPLAWWTVDKLLFDYWRNNIHIEGLDQFRKFTTFDLYYVGISNQRDSLSRLFKNGHKNRTRILSNETQYDPVARLTDELYIFLFDIDPIQIAVIDDNHLESEEFLDHERISKERCIADAEKAFITIMNTRYNTLKYSDYPHSSDGLFDTDLNRWTFTISEDLAFRTPSTLMTFGRWNFDVDGSCNYDFIFVDGEKVDLIKR